MSEDEKPSALVISLIDENPTETIKMILGVEELPASVVLEEGVHAYPLKLDTKYYSADVNLCAVKQKTIGSQRFADTVGAVIIKLDTEKEMALKEVDSWLPFLEEMSPEVQILLCQRCEETSEKGCSRLEVQTWCVENHFELVELDPNDPEEEDEDLPGLAVTFGIRRVRQALESHLWPNMQMKDKGSQQINPSLAAYLNGGVSQDTDAVAELTENLQNTQLNSMMNRIDQLMGTNEESGGDADDGPDMEFADLLSRLSEMKQQAASLPSEQRKQCAEQVVKAFWNAIGGDDDEILDEILLECQQATSD